jgi:transposase
MMNTETITESIVERNKFLESKVAELTVLVKHYEEQFRLLQQKRFGSSSEKTLHDQRQLLIFDEAENEADRHKPEPTLEQITYTRRKRIGKREDDLSGLPVETVIHTLPEEERLCPECGSHMHVMGHSEPRREIEIIPAQVKVIEHVREVYSCRNCENNATSVPVIKASLPEPVVKGSIASPSAVAHIIVQKYVNAIPLYRQEQEFAINGFTLLRQTMANWMIYCAEHWLAPLYALMSAIMLGLEVLHADETVLRVLHEPGRKARNESYMWLYRTGRDSPTPVVIYEYQETRSSSHPKRFLEGFKGYLHADGYAGYHGLPPDITIVGCWAHLRRKFDEAVKSASSEARADIPAQVGLDYCNRLFALEREYEKSKSSANEKLSPEERYAKRIERSKPLVEEFYSWVNNVSALPKSALGKALIYALNQRQYLENVFLDGRLELSNNRAERSIKPFVIGRKNWLFSATPKGARASSVIYSIIETAKENDLKPFEYLKYIFENAPNSQGKSLDFLLPWSDSIPDFCKKEKKSETTT